MGFGGAVYKEHFGKPKEQLAVRSLRNAGTRVVNESRIKTLQLGSTGSAAPSEDFLVGGTKSKDFDGELFSIPPAIVSEEKFSEGAFCSAYILPRLMRHASAADYFSR